jgi:molybdenum cofactor synthesis domain-containing protein
MSAKFLRVLTLEEAKARLEAYWKPAPGVASVSIEDALGLALAEDVISPLDVPPFDRAAYDGFAVRASDTFGADDEHPKSLRLVGRLEAGMWPRKKIRRGECMEITTGAPIPRGADAVVMTERAAGNGKNILVYRAVAPGENVAERGADIRRGQVVVKRGKRINVRDVGAMAAVGVSTVHVFSKPLVAVISTGSELLEPGERLRRGKIYDANGFALSQAVKSCGGEPVRLGIVPDRPSEIRSRVEKALRTCDVLLVSGGSSAGRGDVVPDVVARMGEPGVLVHGLALKPGKPTFIAVIDGKPIFGLPGYPVSALMVFDQLVAPYLRRLAGLEQPERASTRARLACKINSVRGRRELIPVKLSKQRGRLQAVPLMKGSGAIISLSTADGYIEVPSQQTLVEEGELAEVKLFE